MLDLPFQAKMTDRLAAILRRLAVRDQTDDPDMLPSIIWERFDSGPRAGTWNWVLQSFSRKFMRPEDILTVGEVSFHLPAQERHRLKDRVLDWSESEGLVALENTT
jgi:hypothetical protein